MAFFGHFANPYPKLKNKKIKNWERIGNLVLALTLVLNQMFLPVDFSCDLAKSSDNCFETDSSSESVIEFVRLLSIDLPIACENKFD